MITANFDQYSEAWYDIRKGRITGSRFEKMMMGEGTKGYQELIGELVSEIVTGNIEESYKSEIMEDGTEREPEARKSLEDIVGPIHEVGFQMPEEDSPYHDWAGFSPDGIITESGIHVEIKCPLCKTHISYFNDMNQYRWQLQGGLWINKNPHCIFSSYFPGTKQLVLKVEPSAKDQDAIEARIKVTIDRIKHLKEKYEQYES